MNCAALLMRCSRTEKAETKKRHHSLCSESIGKKRARHHTYAVVAVRSIAWAVAGSRCYLIRRYDKRYISPSHPRHYSTCTSCPCVARPKPRPPDFPTSQAPKLSSRLSFGSPSPIAHLQRDSGLVRLPTFIIISPVPVPVPRKNVTIPWPLGTRLFSFQFLSSLSTWELILVLLIPSESSHWVGASVATSLATRLIPSGTNRNPQPARFAIPSSESSAKLGTSSIVVRETEQ